MSTTTKMQQSITGLLSEDSQSAVSARNGDAGACSKDCGSTAVSGCESDAGLTTQGCFSFREALAGPAVHDARPKGCTRIVCPALSGLTAQERCRKLFGKIESAQLSKIPCARTFSKVQLVPTPSGPLHFDAENAALVASVTQSKAPLPLKKRIVGGWQKPAKTARPRAVETSVHNGHLTESEPIRFMEVVDPRPRPLRLTPKATRRPREDWERVLHVAREWNSHWESFMQKVESEPPHVRAKTLARLITVIRKKVLGNIIAEMRRDLLPKKVQKQYLNEISTYIRGLISPAILKQVRSVTSLVSGFTSLFSALYVLWKEKLTPGSKVALGATVVSSITSLLAEILPLMEVDLEEIKPQEVAAAIVSQVVTEPLLNPTPEPEAPLPPPVPEIKVISAKSVPPPPPEPFHVTNEWPEVSGELNHPCKARLPDGDTHSLWMTCFHRNPKDHHANCFGLVHDCLSAHRKFGDAVVSPFFKSVKGQPTTNPKDIKLLEKLADEAFFVDDAYEHHVATEIFAWIDAMKADEVLQEIEELSDDITLPTTEEVSVIADPKTITEDQSPTKAVKQMEEEKVNIISKVLASITVACTAIIYAATQGKQFTLKMVSEAISCFHTYITKGKEMWSSISEAIATTFFGVKTSEEIARETASDFLEKATQFVVTPLHKILGDIRSLYDARLLERNLRNYISQAGKSVPPHLLSNLSRAVEKLTEKIAKCNEILAAGLPRPVGVGVLVHGAQGIGKTSALVRMAADIDAQRYGKKGVYTIDSSKYYGPYAGQEVARTEEFANSLDLKEDKICNDLNTLLSTGAFNLEGAFEKTQPSNIKLLLADTNADFTDIAARLRLALEAKRAFFSRLLCVRAEWANGKFESGTRGTQGHKDDFSHLKFSIQQISKDDKKISFEDVAYTFSEQGRKVEKKFLSYEELKVVIINNLDIQLDNFHRLYPTFHEDLKAMDIASGNIVPAPVQKQGSVVHSVLNITGRPGVGKSVFVEEEFIPYASKMLGMPIIRKQENGTWEALRSQVPKEKCIAILDDAVLTSEDETEFMRFYNDILPNHSLIVFISNYSPVRQNVKLPLLSRWTYPVYSSLFSTEGVYRRAGYHGVYKHDKKKIECFNSLCFISKPTGLTQVSTGEFFSSQRACVFAVSEYQKFLIMSRDIIIREVDQLPIVDKTNFGMHFKSYDEMFSSLKSKASLAMFVGSGNITFTQELSDKVGEVCASDMVYRHSTEDAAKNYMNVIVHYIRSFRRAGCYLVGKIEVGDTVVLVNGATVYVKNNVVATRPLLSFSSSSQSFLITVEDVQVRIPVNEMRTIMYSMDRTLPPMINLPIKIQEAFAFNTNAIMSQIEGEGMLALLDAQKRFEKQQWKAKIAAFGLRICSWMKEHWLISGLFASLMIFSVAKKIFSFFSGSEQKPQAIVREFYVNPGRNKRSWKDKEEYLEWCRNNPRQRGPKTNERYDDDYYKWDRVNERVYEFDDDDELDRYWDEVMGQRRTIKNAGQSKFRADKVTFNEHPSNMYSTCFDSIRSNLVEVSNAEAGLLWGFSEGRSKLFGLGFHQKYLICPRHITEDGKGGFLDTVYVRDERVEGDKKFQARVVKRFDQRDIVIAEITDKTFPAFKDIRNRFVTENHSVDKGMRAIFCRVHDGRTDYHHCNVSNVNFKQPFDYFDDAMPINNVIQCDIEGNVENASWYGDCGLPYFDARKVKSGNGYIFGIHIGGSTEPTDPRMTFSAVTRSDLDVTSGPVKARKNAIEVDEEVVKLPNGQELYMLPEEVPLWMQIQECPNQPLVEFQKEGTVEVLGTVPQRVSQIPDNPFVKTKIYSDMVSALGPPKKIPTKRMSEWTDEERAGVYTLTNGEKSVAAHQSVMFSDVLPEIDEKHLDEVFELAKNQFVVNHGQYCDFLTHVQALNTVGLYDPLRKVLNPLSTDTSAGITLPSLFPSCNKKSDAIVTKEDGTRCYLDNPAGRFLCKKVNHTMKLAIKGKRATSMFKTCLKMEKLPVAKAWKSRVFEVQDAHDVITERIILGKWSSANAFDRKQVACRVGIDPFTNWDALARFHNELACHIDIDYGRWDKRVHPQMYKLVERLFAYARIQTFGDNEGSRQWINAMKVVIDRACNSIHLVENTVFQKHQGIPSGLFLTATLNSIINEMYVFYAWVRMCPTNTTFEDFQDHTRVSVYGDDLLISTDKESVEWFNFVSLQNLLRDELGCSVDASTKDGKVFKYRSDLSDCTFISRHFVYNAHYDQWLGALKKESIEAQLYFVKSHLNNREYLCETIQSCLDEAAIWGSKYYDSLLSIIMRIASKTPFEYLRTGLYLLPYGKAMQRLMDVTRGFAKHVNELDSNKFSSSDIVRVSAFNIKSDKPSQSNEKKMESTKKVSPSTLKRTQAFRKANKSGQTKAKKQGSERVPIRDKSIGEEDLPKKVVKMMETAKPSASSSPNAGAPAAAAVATTGIIPMSDFDASNALDTTGSACATPMNLNMGAIPPAPQTTGAPFNKLDQMKTTGLNLTRSVITSDSKTGAVIATFSNDPEKLPADLKQWTQVHQYWTAQTCHVLQVNGTEGTIGSLIVGWVPDISKTYVLNDLRKVSWVQVPLNKFSEINFQVDDFRNNNFNRLTVGDTNPYPGYVVMLLEPLANKFASDGKAFEIGVWTDTFFHPACDWFNPQGSLVPSTNAQSLGTLASQSMTVPHNSDDRIDIYVGSSQIPTLNLGTDSTVVSAPTTSGFYETYETEYGVSSNFLYLASLTTDTADAAVDLPVSLFFTGTMPISYQNRIVKAFKDAIENGTSLQGLTKTVLTGFNNDAVTVLEYANVANNVAPLNFQATDLEAVTQLSVMGATNVTKFFGFNGEMTFPDGTWRFQTATTSAVFGVVWNSLLPLEYKDLTVSYDASAALPLLPWGITSFVVPLGTTIAKSMRAATYTGGCATMYKGYSPEVTQVKSCLQPSFTVHDFLAPVVFMSEACTASYDSKQGNAPVSSLHLDLVAALLRQCDLLGSSLIAFEVFESTNTIGTMLFSKRLGLMCAPTNYNRVLTGVNPAGVVIRNIRSVSDESISTTRTSAWDSWISTAIGDVSSDIGALRSLGQPLHSESQPKYSKAVKQAGIVFGGLAGLAGGISDAYWKNKQMDWQTSQNELDRKQAQYLQELRGANTLDNTNLSGSWNVKNTLLSYQRAGENQIALAREQSQLKTANAEAQAKIAQRQAGLLGAGNINRGRFTSVAPTPSSNITSISISSSKRPPTPSEDDEAVQSGEEPTQQ